MALRGGIVSSKADAGRCSIWRVTTIDSFGVVLMEAFTCCPVNSCSNCERSDWMAASNSFMKPGTAALNDSMAAILARSSSANDLIQLLTIRLLDSFHFWPAALERFAFGRKLSEVFRAALGGLFPAQAPGIGGDELIRNPFSAVWTFHVAKLQHGLLFVK